MFSIARVTSCSPPCVRRSSNWHRERQMGIVPAADWTYSLIMLAAVATGALLSRGSQAGLGLPWVERLAIGLGAFCGAMIGAKLPFVLADWGGMLSGAAWFSDG